MYSGSLSDPCTTIWKKSIDKRDQPIKTDSSKAKMSVDDDEALRLGVEDDEVKKDDDGRNEERP